MTTVWVKTDIKVYLIAQSKFFTDSINNLGKVPQFLLGEDHIVFSLLSELYNLKIFFHLPLKIAFIYQLFQLPKQIHTYFYLESWISLGAILLSQTVQEDEAKLNLCFT